MQAPILFCYLAGILVFNKNTLAKKPLYNLKWLGSWINRY